VRLLNKCVTPLFVALLAGVMNSALAQVDTATLNGTVTDPSGGVIRDTKVTAVSSATGEVRTVITNRDGIYILPKLPAAEYTLQFSSGHFQSLTFEHVKLEAGQNVTLDARLQVATTTTQVEVRSAEPLLERNTAEISATVGSEQIDNLPTNGRNWANLLILAPLAVDDGGGDERSIRFAGRARDDNNYRMDGIDATGIQEQAQKSTTRLQIPTDAVEEYRVNSALYTAEYGAGSGGQVDLVSKSGTNNFHGEAFDYLRNSIFDSRSFLDIDNDPAATGPTTVPPFRMNQFGAGFGGPIVKDQTFFFVSFEGIQQFRGQTLHAFVPSLAFKAQVMSQSPQLAPILNVYPTGQLSVDPNTDEYTRQGAIHLVENSGLMRLDHRISDRTFLSFRLAIDDSFTSAPLGNLLDKQEIINRPQNYMISLQHIFSPTIFNEAKFGINRSPFHNPQVSLFPYAVSFANFEPLNNNNTDNEVGTTYSWIDNLSIVRGRHTFKVGMEVRRIDLNQGITEDNSINFDDNNAILADHVSSFLLKSSWCCRGLRHSFILPYFQDEWKVLPNLTINMGLRWEYYSPVYEVKDRVRIFDLYRCQGICSPNSALEFPNYTNFDPRFAIAWAVTPKTAIRTGFGIYHAPAQNDDRNAALESDNVRISLTSADDPNLSYPIEPFIPLASVAGRTPRALQRDRKDLYATEYGLSIQQNLPAQFVLDTGYFASQGRRLFERTFINTIDPATGLRPLPGFDQIDLKRNDANSSFNALHVSLQRNFTAGWLFGMQYMWSHSINDGSVGGGESNAPQNVLCRECDRASSVYDVRHNVVVNSVYELPFGHDKPYLQSGFLGAVFGGWQLSSIGTWHTGHPLTVNLNIDPSLIPDGNANNVRPDVVSGVSVVPANQNANNWVNPAAFTAPPSDPNGVLLRFGNAGRSLISAPTVWQIDVALQREFKLNEKFSLQFIAQAFNIFNKDQLADPNNLTLDYNPPDATHPTAYVVPEAGFGQITSLVNLNSNSDKFAADNTGAGLPRELQFALRLQF